MRSLSRLSAVISIICCLLPDVQSTIVAPNALNLRLTANVSHAIPPTLYGYMWEDINHSGDGGLYAELLQNRAFQAVIPGTQNALNAWQPYNGAFLSVTSKTKGVSAALPNSLEVRIPKVVNGPIGFENTGYWGIKIQEGWTYKGSFYAKSDTFSGKVTVSLKSVRGTVFASKSVGGISKSWKKFTFEFNPASSAPNDENVFSVLFDGKAAAGKTIHFGMFSLFPPTFRGRENGMRIDLAEALAATRPSIWRFPGGNNLEGHSIDTRWKWNETIGRVEDRPGRVGDWGYSNTDGLGLLEYLNWAEDLEAEPILGVWAGISIANYSDFATWPVVPEQDLQPYIEDVLAQIDFVIGDAKTTKGGKSRASLGRTEPYALRLIEIGNEDQFQPTSYAAYRWKAFVDAISAKYPHLEFIATTLPSTALDPVYKKSKGGLDHEICVYSSSLPILVDFHMYNSPSWFITNAFMFDDYPRNGSLFFVGEYAVTSTNDSNALGDIPSGRLAYPTLQGAAAEAAFMTGLERNSDVVFASAYAPSFQHIRNYQWTPDIITYDASHVVKSTSYYVQQMFSLNRGTHVLKTSPASTADSEPLFWVASYSNETSAVFLKVSNTGTTDLVANIFLDFPITGFGTATSISSPGLSPISGVFNVSNTIEEPELIIPIASSFAIPHPDRFNYTFPATSVTVITLHTPSLGSL
ncbi:glycoside hydrolase [Lyophyllum atratum]|nr:glycoside hydrolase [Lyophyllum atratum]